MGTELANHHADLKSDASDHIEDAAPDCARNIYANFVPPPERVLQHRAAQANSRPQNPQSSRRHLEGSSQIPRLIPLLGIQSR
ncbi:hypothetical protein E5D57_007568 [Metarhizium anisopliae]|nr:hypothetical protein E5D57_007568 [Metarhizium anisopliae]